MIHAYTYGASSVPVSPVTLGELNDLKTARGRDQQTVDGMHRAWCKSVQLQLALWRKPYSSEVTGEW